MNEPPTVVYVDASRDDHVSGIGYTIRGKNIDIQDNKYLEGHYTSMEAEFHALVEAVRVASQASDDREECEVYTDCEPLVRKVCGGPDERRDWEQYRQSARWLLNKFETWELRHTSRDFNEDAHQLARDALREGRDQNL